MARTAVPFVAIGSVEQVRDFICGPLQHNEHCKGWRWHLYLQDTKRRTDAFLAETRAMIARERAAKEATFQQAAE